VTRRARSLLLLPLCAAALGAQAQAPVRPAAPTDFVAPGPIVPLQAPLMSALGGLRASSLGAHIALLSSPALEGRGLGSRGLDAAAEYVASQLALAGIGPVEASGAANPASPYFHSVPLRQVSHPSCQVRIEATREGAVETRTFLAGVDALCPERAPGALSAPLVFAGYGVRESSPARDDYRDLDVRGKVVLLLAGIPPGPEWQRPDLRARYAAESGRQRFAAKAQLAAALGARAVLAVEGPEFVSTLASGADAPAAVFYQSFDDESEAALPVLRVSEAAGQAMLAAGGIIAGPAATPRPSALDGVVCTVTLGGDERLVTSRNVIGMVRGADAALRAEAVVIGAHVDHLGLSGDVVYPGADDNASGVAALLEIARAFAASGHPPRRTVVFAFWTGEEEGHLGSGHYVRHPVWPLERTVVYLNLDMIAHPWTAAELKTLVADTRLERGDEFLARVKPGDFIELGVADWAPDLAPVLGQAARATGVALHFDWTSGKSGGSDYREFARRGRPWVRFFGNYFDGYHGPADTVEKLDAGQVLKMTRLALASAWLLADR